MSAVPHGAICRPGRPQGTVDTYLERAGSRLAGRDATVWGGDATGPEAGRRCRHLRKPPGRARLRRAGPSRLPARRCVPERQCENRGQGHGGSFPLFFFLMFLISFQMPAWHRNIANACPLLHNARLASKVAS